MFCYIENVKQREIIYRFKSLEELVNYVRSSDREEYESIKEARKHGRGTEEYRVIKTNEIPCTAINFNYKDGYINGNNVSSSTGYMYIDIDEEFDVGDVDINCVAAYWKSLSNQGYSLVVKVEGLSVANLKESYRYVASTLDIPYDPQAVSIDRLTLLSYDPEAYYNAEAGTFMLSELENPRDSEIKSILHGYNCNGENLRFNNLGEMVSNLGIEIKFDKDGIFDLTTVLGKKLIYGESFLPKGKICKGSREKHLSMFANQFIALNRDMSKALLKKVIKNANKKKMSPPLSNIEVDEIFNKKYKNRHNLKIIPNRTRRFLYEEGMGATKKRSKTMKRINTERSQSVKSKIESVLLNWDFGEQGKITIAKVKELSGCAMSTVEKYLNKLLEELGISKTGKHMNSITT